MDTRAITILQNYYCACDHLVISSSKGSNLRQSAGILLTDICPMDAFKMKIIQKVYTHSQVMSGKSIIVVKDAGLSPVFLGGGIPFSMNLFIINARK